VNAVVAVFVVIGLALTTVAAFAFNWAILKEAREQIRTVRSMPRGARSHAMIRGTIAAIVAVVLLGLIIVEPFGEQHTAEFTIGGLGALLFLGINGYVAWLLWHNRRRRP
jgi:drug/metabolite transporter (DMT)-like permease